MCNPEHALKLWDLLAKAGNDDDPTIPLKSPVTLEGEFKCLPAERESQ